MIPFSTKAGIFNVQKYLLSEYRKKKSTLKFKANDSQFITGLYLFHEAKRTIDAMLWRTRN